MMMRRMSRWPHWCGGLFLVALLAAAPFAGRGQEGPPAPKGDDPKPQPDALLGKDWLKPLKWRSIGPAAMGGRITAISVYEKDPTIYYVATASGGLLRTSNAGTTFEHQFDHEKTVSVGDVCIAPSDPNIVWVGTGENNARNSVSYGDGVYKSTDGGKHWRPMGLTKSFQIGKILVHPTNPDIVYVGALGRLYGANKERGLYKTSDGGKTWEQILFVDDHTGVIDMRMHPQDPDTLLVATYERKRDAFDYNDPIQKWGKGSGLYKTTDGGKKFQKITSGLPTCELGRIGLDWYQKDPKVVYMVLESEKIGMVPKGVQVANAFVGILGEDAPDGARLTNIVDKGPAQKAGLQVNDIVLELDKKKVKSYQGLVTLIGKYKPEDKVDVKVRRGNDIKVLNLVFGSRSEPGGRPLGAYLGGQKENKQDVQGKEGYEYGGVYKSTDGGDSWVRINSLNPRPFYFSQIRVDPSDANHVYVLGIGIHNSRDGGKTFGVTGKGAHADFHALWIDPRDGRHMILGSDGGFYVTHDRMGHWDYLNNLAIGQFYHVDVDPRPHYKVYGGLQDNGSWGGPAFTTSFTGPVNTDWFRVGGGDGFRCVVDPKEPEVIYFTMQYGGLGRRNLQTGEVVGLKPAEKKGVKYRWNWNTPFILSPHNHKVYYCGAQFLFKSIDRGKDLQAISPDLTRTDQGSLFAISESPKSANVLYAGTDDGALWVTVDGGKNWSDITKNVGLPGLRWVASLEASRHVLGRCYAVFDGHRSDDDEPYAYVTEDFGKTWKSLRGNLPWGSARILREDLYNPNVLYLGTEFGAWCSLDRGQSWNSLNTNLPTVAVHEFAQHPTSGEIVAATHGRSLWILDVSALRQLQPGTLTKDVQLYKPAPGIEWVMQPGKGTTNREFVGDNRPQGAQIYYSLPQAGAKVSLTILDGDGKKIAQLKADNAVGLHRAAWNMRKAAAGKPGEFTLVPAGTYRVALDVDGQELTQPLQIMADPGLPPNTGISADQSEKEDGDREAHHFAD